MNDSGRVEAFSDGVFAIAITLLILEIKVPEANEHGGLWHALGAQWPSYIAYVVSFLVIGIMWINHHHLFSYVAYVDRTLMFLNLLLLMVVAALPFPTAMLADYLRDDAAASHVAAVVYSLVIILVRTTFQSLWWYLTRVGNLFDARVDTTATRSRFAWGSLLYPATVGLAFVSAPLTLIAHGLIALYYGFNEAPVPTRPDPATS